jgi:hypothetical protein
MLSGNWSLRSGEGEKRWISIQANRNSELEKVFLLLKYSSFLLVKVPVDRE